MRKSLVLAILTLVSLAGWAPGQFISDVRPHWPGGHIGRPHPLRPVVVDRHQVISTVRDGLAQTTVRQSFRNPNRVQLEGTYFFPLPEGAALQNFALRMGERWVKGEVLDKDKAAGIYQGIVRRKRDPALLEYVGRRLFRARVFPIPAGGVTQIELSFSQSLRRDGKLIEYRYPFRTRGVLPTAVGEASFELTISSSQPIRTVYSPSHQVKVIKTGDHRAKVSFTRKQDPGDRDLVVVYSLSSRPVGASLFTHVESGSEQGSFLLLLSPSASKAAEIAAKDVVFVVDTSGSMAGPKLEQTRKALTYCINSLHAQDHFEVIPFSTEASPLFGSLLGADDTAKERARALAKNMVARGGTNIEEALVRALGLSRDKTRPFMIIFLTDGEPTIGITRPEDILSHVKQANQALTRLFVFGIGEDLNADLLDRLADDNHGSRDYVGSKEDIEVKVSSFFSKVSSPVLSDLDLSFSGVSVTDVYPKQLPDLFRDAQLLVTGRFQGAGEATLKLSGKLNGKAVSHEFKTNFKKGSEHTAFVPRLWAVRKVGYLMDQIRLHGVASELKAEVVRLGKKYGIVTPYTSYLVVEDDVAMGPRIRGGGGGRGRRRGWRSGNRILKSDKDLGNRKAPHSAGLAVPADRFLGGEEARLGKSPARKAGRLYAPAAGSPAEEKKSKDAPSYVRDVDLVDSRSKAVDRLIGNYFDGAISMSKQVKSLREAASAQSGSVPLIVRRIGDRTFYHRSGFYVEAPILDLSSKDIKARLVRVEAFSATYLKLATERHDLARILALGQRILLLDGARIIQIVPASPQEKTATEHKKK